MTADDKAKLLLEMLVTAMIITMQKQEEEGEPDVPGLVGGPEGKNDPKPETKPQGFGDVFALNKLTDLMMRSLQVAARHRVALELGILYIEEDDLSMVEETPIGITFNMKLKKDMDMRLMKKVELAADMSRHYFHYRLFEKDPTVSDFLDQVDWKDSIETDPDLDEDEREASLAFFDEAMPEVVQILHVYHDSIKEHGGRIFNKSLAYVHKLLSGTDKDYTRSRFDVLFGIKPSSLSDILRMNLNG